MTDVEQDPFWDLNEKDTWMTPDSVVDTLKSHVDIELDPCAGLYTFIGQENWTIETDGSPSDTKWSRDGRVLRMGIDSLDRPWDTGGLAYMNPPFSMKEQFIDTAIAEVEADNLDGVVVLTPDSTDVQSWWHETLAPHAPVVWFSKGRISFVDPDSGEQKKNPTFGTALHFVGDLDQWPRSLFDELDEMGEVDVRWEHVVDAVEVFHDE